MPRRRRPRVGPVEVTLEPHGVYIAKCGASPTFIRVDPFQAACMAVRDRIRMLERQKKRRGVWHCDRNSTIYPVVSWIHSTRQTHPVKEDSCLPNF